MGQNRLYISGIIAAFLLLSITILGFRWHVLASRTAGNHVPVEDIIQPAGFVDIPVQQSAEPGESQMSGRININTATAEELTQLPGIGPALAKRIVEHRSENGNFASVGGLTAVKGIGEATVEKLGDLATVGE